MMMILLQAFFGGALAAIGFGVLYNITSKMTLFLAGVTGAIGSFAYQLCIELGMTVLSASFYGAAGFTLAASLFSKLRDEPDTMFLVPALIPLVPGGTVFQMMTAFLEGRLYVGLGRFLDALAIAGMLVFGMMVVGAVLKLIVFFQHGATRTTKKITRGAVNIWQGVSEDDGGMISIMGNLPSSRVRGRRLRRKKWKNATQANPSSSTTAQSSSGVLANSDSSDVKTDENQTPDSRA